MEDKEIDEAKPTSSSNKETLQKQRQDLALLKRAIRTLREEREKEMKEEKEYEERVAVLELSVSEKDSILSLLEQDIFDLEYKLENMKPKNEEANSSSSDSADEHFANNIILYETLNKKLIEDLHNASIRYGEVCVAKQALLKDLDIKRRAVASMDQTLSQEVNKKTLELFELTRQTEIITKELEDAKQLNMQLSSLNVKNKEDLVTSKFTSKQVLREKQSIENQLLELLKQIPDLQHRLMTQGENSALLSAKLVQLKQRVNYTQMAEAKQYYQRFSAFVNMKGFSDKTDVLSI